ncbi:MAG: M48 family metalloprotease [Elainella sp.]
MSDFPDSGASGSAPADPAQTALQEGLAALKQQDYQTAIAHLEPCQHSSDRNLSLKARMALVKAYARTGQAGTALELCRPLCQHPNPQVRQWAEQSCRELEPEGEVESAGQARVDLSDATGFQPFAASTGNTPTGNTSTGSTRFRPVAPTQAGPAQPSQQTASPIPSAPDSASNLAPDSAPDSAPDPEPPDRLPAPQTAPTPVLPAEQADPIWQNAGRSSRWTSLGRVDASGLWALEVGSLVLLFYLCKGLLEALFRLWNWFTVELSQLLDLPRLLLPESVDLPLLLVLLALGLAAPWLLELSLRAYGLRPFSLAQLERSSPESSRLLKRTTQRQMPQLALLPSPAPLLFSFGYLPSQSRLVVSQGLLDRLQPDEIACLVAAELAHIRYWDFGAMTVISLVCQVPYLIYWRVAQLGDRWANPVLRTLAIGVSSVSYGLFWWLRLAGLWLSRVRLYYSDRLATDLTGNPNGLARALLKLAMGTAEVIQSQKATAPLLEGFELLTPVGYRSALTQGSLYNGDPGLFQWDRANPYRRWLLLNQSHPLLGERLALLMQYGQQWRLEPELGLGQLGRLRANWGRLALQGAPFWGIPLGVLAGLLLWGLGWLARQWRWFELAWLVEDRSLPLACALLGFGIGMFLRINAYYPDIKRNTLSVNPDLPALLSRIEALPLDSLPVQFKGTLLGRSGLQNWLHRDLMLQTPTGLIRLHYTSRLGWLGDLFPQAIRPTALLDRSVTVTGWFRRGATPWIEVETLQSEYGRTLRSYHPIWSTILASAAVLLAVWLILRGA